MHALGRTLLRTLGQTLADPLESVQIDQDVGQRVVIGDGHAIAQLGTLDAQGDSLTVDAFGSRTLLVDLLVRFAIAVDLVAHPRSFAGGQGCDTALLGPALVLNGAVFTSWFWVAQGTGIPTARVGDEGRAALVSVLEGHGEPGVTEGKSIIAEGANLPTSPLSQGDGGKASGLVKVLVDVESIEGGVEGTEAWTTA